MTDTDDEVRGFYGRLTPIYDRIATLPPAASWRDRTAASLGLDPGDTAIEMGCGTGANLPYLRERVGAHGRVIGFDLTREMLLRARDRGREPGGVIQADATGPPLAGNVDAGRDATDASRETIAAGCDSTDASRDTVDAILGTFVVGLFADPAAVVEDWCDIVAPGGRLALLHFHASDRAWAPPANAVYRGLVRASAPNAVRATGAAAHHDARVRDAHEALERRAERTARREFAGGFLRLVVGRMPEA